MIEHLLMLTCGWVGGVVSTLLIRHTLDGRRPLDPALLPTAVPMPIAALVLPPAPQLSPYAPKPKRTWQAPKRERITRWVVDASKPPAKQDNANALVATFDRSLAHRQRDVFGAHAEPSWKAAPPASVAPPATALLPSIAWGTPHGGEGGTLTRERSPMGQSTAENGHGAQTPRHRA